MNKGARILIASASILGSFLVAQTLHAQATEIFPQIIVKDSSGAVVGPAHATTNILHVFKRDPTNGDPFYLQFGKFWFRTADTDEMFFTGANCTGVAYVYAPKVLDSSLQHPRGSVYVLGPGVGGGTTPVHIYRSVDGAVPADNSGILTTKWELSNSNFGELEGPTCTTTGTGTDTVAALPVAALDSFVSTLLANRPFSVE